MLIKRRQNFHYIIVKWLAIFFYGCITEIFITIFLRAFKQHFMEKSFLKIKWKLILRKYVKQYKNLCWQIERKNQFSRFIEILLDHDDRNCDIRFDFGKMLSRRDKYGGKYIQTENISIEFRHAKDVKTLELRVMN